VFRDKKPFARLDIPGLSTTTPRGNLVLMATVFALFGVGITLLRKGPFGRRLQALKDSPAACATLGIDPTVLKLQVFALSASIAGVGGALYAGWRGQVGGDQFSLLNTEPSALPLLLLTVIAGIAAVAGALAAGLLISLVPLLAEDSPNIQNLLNLLPGLAGIGLAANPDGFIAQTAQQVGAAWHKVRRRGEEERPDTLGGRLLTTLTPDAATLVPEHVGAGRPVSLDELAVLDAETGYDWGRCRVAVGDE
jgi:ABC-type branched-subunit amino acid transport system permease subunit